MNWLYARIEMKRWQLFAYVAYAASFATIIGLFLKPLSP